MENTKLKGHFILEHRNSDGELLNKVEKDNIIVKLGYDDLLRCAFDGNVGTRPDAFAWIALGTNQTTPADDDAILGAEHTRQSAQYTVSDYPTTDYCEIATTFTGVIGAPDIAEAGLFNALSGGVMFDRVIFTPIPISDADSLTTTFQISVGPSA